MISTLPALLNQEHQTPAKERVRINFPVLRPGFARFSVTKVRNRTTVPALLFNQNERIRTQPGRWTGKLLRTRSWYVLTYKQLFQKVLFLEQLLENTSDFLY